MQTKKCDITQKKTKKKSIMPFLFLTVGIIVSHYYNGCIIITFPTNTAVLLVVLISRLRSPLTNARSEGVLGVWCSEVKGCTLLIVQMTR